MRKTAIRIEDAWALHEEREDYPPPWDPRSLTMFSFYQATYVLSRLRVTPAQARALAARPRGADFRVTLGGGLAAERIEVTLEEAQAILDGREPLVALLPQRLRARRLTVREMMAR